MRPDSVPYGTSGNSQVSSQNTPRRETKRHTSLFPITALIFIRFCLSLQQFALPPQEAAPLPALPQPQQPPVGYRRLCCLPAYCHLPCQHSSPASVTIPIKSEKIISNTRCKSGDKSSRSKRTDEDMLRYLFLLHLLCQELVALSPKQAGNKT